MSPARLDAPARGPLLQVEDLCTTFDSPRGSVAAVQHVSLSLDRGRTLGIVGESGSGKTVLSRSIMGLLPARGVRRSGRVLFDGRDLVPMTPRQLSAVWGAEISMVFQDPVTSLSPVMRVGPQITDCLRRHLGLSRTVARARAIDLLRSVGIPEPARRFEQYPHELSGGMCQRVVIAIALACEPTVLLADEPTTSLDVTVQAQILDLLEQARSERDMAMILVSHDLGVVAGRTDEVVVMYAGRVVERAPTPVLFRDMKMPYTEALMESIPKLAGPAHARLRAIGGRPPDLVNPPPGCPFAPRCAYARDRCRVEAPPLREASPGHLFACWYPVGTAEGSEAPALNQGTGVAGAAPRPLAVPPWPA
jgi:oligopeptide/dipeptide ABC transporter ATP-binding protein